MKRYKLKCAESGRIIYKTVPQILAEVNLDRSQYWVDYTEKDWLEGMTEWTSWELNGDPNYSEMTDDEFDNILTELLLKKTANSLITLPGIYEILREEFNNDILSIWELENPEKAYAEDMYK